MEKPVTHIHPPKGFSLGFRELWQYRELFYFFTWRDIKVKYKQTYLGILWAIIQPLLMMILFTVLFSKTWKIDTGPVVYPVFVLSGLILWGLFSSAVSHAGDSMIQHANIIRKIYFPRLIIPGASVLVALFDFMMGLIVFLVILVIDHQHCHWNAVLYFPAAILLIVLAGFGTGTFLAALNVKYRDFRYVIPFALQVLFFSSQVIFPLDSVHPVWLKNVLALNPVNAAIELMRAPLSGSQPDTTVLSIGLASTLVLLMAGIYFFRKTESYFADLA